MVISTTKYHASDDPHERALWSAVVLRDCSLRPQTSAATRRACRRLIREQAIKWRQGPVLLGVPPIS